MPYDPADPKWVQFRRLLLGTVVECLTGSGLAAELSAMRIEFDGESEFHVPRLDNSMRFKGRFFAALSGAPGPERGKELEALQRRLAAQWPVLVSTLDVIPLGDRLTVTRNQIVASTGPDGRLRIDFDLEAD